MAKSSVAPGRRKVAVKPNKPRSDFPLFAHASGKWAKTILGKTHYFGRWDDPDAAEAEYLEVAEDLHAGRVPRLRSANGTGTTVADICNAFMRSKRGRMEAGSLSPRTFIDYDKTCRILIETFGRNRTVSDLRPADFSDLYRDITKGRRLGSVGGHITQTRMIFRFAEESELIQQRVRFGPDFKAPSASDRRKAKARQKSENGSRTFEAAQIRQMLETPSEQLKAMILLGINAGFGNTDCASLPLDAVDLTNGWIDFPRPKTGIERRVPLWNDTIDALTAVIANRKKAANPADEKCVFLTRYRQRWVRFDIAESKRFGRTQVRPKQDDAIAKATGKLLRELGLKRPGLSFYSLRHTFETIAGGCRDQVAVDAIMGHVDSSMAANYRHGIEDERLRAVTEHVRKWLFEADDDSVE